jgi:hypothetical protein
MLLAQLESLNSEIEKQRIDIENLKSMNTNLTTAYNLMTEKNVAIQGHHAGMQQQNFALQQERDALRVKE